MIARSRRIVVDGRPFRWALPARRVPYRWESPGPVRNTAVLTVVADSGRPGRVAQARLSWEDGKPVTPEAIAIVVRGILAEGWDPDERGPAFRAKEVDVGTLDVAYVREQTVREVMES